MYEVFTADVLKGRSKFVFLPNREVCGDELNDINALTQEEMGVVERTVFLNHQLYKQPLPLH